MAESTTTTYELNVYLSSADDNASRTLKIYNPRSGLTLEDVTTALAPMVATVGSGSSTTPAYFFYDDGNQGGYDYPMTKINYAEYSRVTKTITRLEES